MTQLRLPPKDASSEWVVPNGFCRLASLAFTVIFPCSPQITSSILPIYIIGKYLVGICDVIDVFYFRCRTGVPNSVFNTIAQLLFVYIVILAALELGDVLIETTRRTVVVTQLLSGDNWTVVFYCGNLLVVIFFSIINLFRRRGDVGPTSAGRHQPHVGTTLGQCRAADVDPTLARRWANHLAFSSEIQASVLNSLWPSDKRSGSGN